MQFQGKYFEGNSDLQVRNFFLERGGGAQDWILFEQPSHIFSIKLMAKHMQAVIEKNILRSVFRRQSKFG